LVLKLIIVRVGSKDPALFIILIDPGVVQTTTQPSQPPEVFDSPQPGREYTIRMNIPEFTCRHAKTSQPDFATLKL
jgi:NADPH-dependent 7-cyano-7-deazaguanine reductase QueF